MQINISTANETDLDQICILAEEILEVHAANAPNAFVAGGIERDRDYWHSTITTPDSAILLAREPAQNSLVGFIVLRFLATPPVSFLHPQKVARINTIIVAKAQRQQGIGQQLLDAAYDWARQQGAAEIKLEVFSWNEGALALHRRNGFGVQSLLMNKVL